MNENIVINTSDATERSIYQSDVHLKVNRTFTSQPGFQCTSLEEDAALNFAKPSDDNSGVVQIFEFPMSDAPYGLYTAGTDPYKQSQAHYST